MMYFLSSRWGLFIEHIPYCDLLRLNLELQVANNWKYLMQKTGSPHGLWPMDIDAKTIWRGNFFLEPKIESSILKLNPGHSHVRGTCYLASKLILRICIWGPTMGPGGILPHFVNIIFEMLRYVVGCQFSGGYIHNHISFMAGKNVVFVENPQQLEFSVKQSEFKLHCNSDHDHCIADDVSWVYHFQSWTYHLDPPVNRQAVVFLKGLLEDFLVYFLHINLGSIGQLYQIDRVYLLSSHKSGHIVEHKLKKLNLQRWKQQQQLGARWIVRTIQL